MRLDGFKPEHEYGQLEKAAFLKRLSELGVKNIEMESTGFAALTHRAKLKGSPNLSSNCSQIILINLKVQFAALYWSIE